ncbi:B-cell differentiation antigen CD72 isoform X2 [Antechinus flavipes]|uniref:B-cell differentiation antigen CD72 isoform X2 n=1 Tax=Antechinus flavipes TaxID=38775 RepID=UPI002235EA13|nr:B-cell differentiation antigen CD72 isoform X2 [Antechinus flavipes]
MAESITYADLRFVKSPLKKSLSAIQKQDPEVDEDGELTYENVQVPSVKDVFPSPDQPACEGQTGGEKTDKSVAVPYSVISPVARKILPCPMTWTPYIILSLLGTCLLLGITTISLGIQYMQLSHQLSNINQVLEVTNGSLRQQLQNGATQLSSKEKDLQVTREDLTQTQKELKIEKDQHGATENLLLTCRLEWNKTKMSLENNIEEKRNLEEKLNILQKGLNQVQPLFNCLPRNNVGFDRREDHEWRQFHQFQEYCCPLGWTLFKNKCLYISSCEKTWKGSDSFCQSLSSKLLVWNSLENKYSDIQAIKEIIKQKTIILSHFWIQERQTNHKTLREPCPVIKPYSSWISTDNCNENFYFICEKQAIERQAIERPVEMEDRFLP